MNVNTHTSGWMTFAVSVITILGLFHAITGLLALLQPDQYVISDNELLIFNFTVWGWAHLLFGALLIIGAAGLVAKQKWAKVTTIVLVGLSALANFGFIMVFPVGSVVMIALDLLIIYAIALHAPTAGLYGSQRIIVKEEN